MRYVYTAVFRLVRQHLKMIILWLIVDRMKMISHAEIVSWIAQMSGNFARCNVDGALELKWYDFGVFETGNNIDGGQFDIIIQVTV